MGFIFYLLYESYYKANDFDADRNVIEDIMSKKMESNTKKSNILESNMGEIYFS